MRQPRILNLIRQHPTQHEQPGRIVVDDHVQRNVDHHLEEHVRRRDPIKVSAGRQQMPLRHDFARFVLAQIHQNHVRRELIVPCVQEDTDG